MDALGKYMFIGAVKKSPSGKTKVWSIVDRHVGLLGTVAWYGPWRCYAFRPCQETVFNGACMDALSEFCKKRTLDHRNKTE